MPLTSPETRQRLTVADIGGSHITAAVVEQVRPGSASGASLTRAPAPGTLAPPATARGTAALPVTASVIGSFGVDTDPHGAGDDILDAWATACRTVVELTGDSSADAWAFAMPDPFDFEHGRGTFENVSKFEHLSGVDIRGELARRLGAEPASVRFLHDAAAYGIGEWMFGAASGHDRAVCITLGTGVGSAFLDHGSPVSTRADVPTNGTAHLIEIDGRPLEETVSTRAIIAHYAARTGERTTVKTIADRARAADTTARNVLDHAFFALGAALAPWLDAFEATVLVAGGSISRSWDLLEPSFRAGLAAEHPRLAAALQVAPSALLDDAPLLGAAAWLSRTD